jgi:hypothetical protein
MDINAEKLALMRWLLETDNEQLIQKIKRLFAQEKTEGWDELPQAVQQQVLAAEKEIEEGQGIPHEQVVATYASRLR